MKVYDTENDCIKDLDKKNINKGDIIVIRYQGPKGGPGMPEMLKPTSAIVGHGLLGEVAFITDGRFSGGSHGFIIGHVSPEAYDGGNIALIKNGDIIEIDATLNTINICIDNKELENRKQKWKKPNKKLKGYLYKYKKLVKCASKGCITD